MQAACAYALISLIDPSLYVSSGLLHGFTMTARDGSVLNPRFPAPVNTYNPTIHALVDAIFDAMSHIVPGKVRADGSGSRSIILGGRNTYTGKGYVQYEIIAGGAGARASRDGASGITVNQSNAKIAPIEIIESEFPDPCHPLRVDPGFGRRRRVPRRPGHSARISQSRRCAVLYPLDEAPDPAQWLRRRQHRPPRRHLDQSRQRGAKRLPTRYADYPLKEGDVFRLDTPGGGGHGDPLARDPERVLADVRDGHVSVAAAERHYGVVLAPPSRSWALDRPATQARRARMKSNSAPSGV